MRTYALSVKFVTFAKLNKRTSKSKMRALHTTILHTTIILALIHTATIAAPARVAINPPKESLQQDGDILKVYTISNREDSLLLRQKCTDFTPDELSSAEFAHFAEMMIKTVTHPSQDGVGIAGPQVGLSKRVVAVQRFDKEGQPFIVYPNISIVAYRGDLVPGPEGCLSVPECRGEVLRYRDIDIEYTSPQTLERVRENVKGFTAVIFQHEVDHLEGILYTDRAVWWARPEAWYIGGGVTAAPGKPNAAENLRAGASASEQAIATWPAADYLYFISTEVASSTDGNGNKSLRAALTPQERVYIDAEMKYAEKNLCGENFRFISPYYHQYTFEAFSGRTKEDTLKFLAVKEEVTKEAIEAFRYYMKHLNNGRQFVLAGFSQGAQLSIEIVKAMREEELSKMAAAYIIGYRLTEEDLSHPNIKAAEDETSRGVCISFNSALSEKGIWEMTSGGAATCINPLNWHRDTTAAVLEYNGLKGKVRVDTKNNVLMVEIDKSPFHKWMEEHPLFGKAGMDKECLHHWDLLFYTESLKKNAAKRAYVK